MKKRVISVIILVALMAAFVFLSETTRVLFFGIAGILCAYEYIKRFREKGINITAWLLYAYLAIQIALAITNCGRTAYIAWYIVSVYLALFSGIVHKDVSGKGAIYTLSALAYPCFPFALMMIISTSSRVWETLALSCLPVWAWDAFALFGGMWWGKHKVAPDVSPNKTIEGCITGSAASVIVGFLISIFYKSIPWYVCIITAFISSTAGQIGDLAESLIKRYLDIKDFSNLIPGHGGMLDRADSLMFAIPTAYFCLYIFGL